MSLTKADINKQGWEDSEFPILCETCLGDNPYVRMSKQPFGKECKTCNRPFTVFRWLPGSNMRHKKTEICQNCAKLKNVCQTCILDLQYGLPVQVRDTALGIKPDAPTTDINRQYHAQNLANKIDDDSKDPYGGGQNAASNRDILKSLARTEPHYKRNRAHICSFFVRGECNRGASCPYRHEIPEENKELSRQNIKDRYRGINDPVAKKILSKTTNMRSSLAPPEDKSVTTLFITGVEPKITQEDIKGFFYAFGEIKSIIVIHKSKCAFVNFVTRTSAELAAEKIASVGLVLLDTPLRVTWGKPKPRGPKTPEQPDLTKMKVPAPPSLDAKDSNVKYPSQDPTSQGSTALGSNPTFLS
ncbi:uncharacterized protein BX664DRAFT_295391 [Halteromyces radiatus]|uniref:uncharacterized protein n=1 Tax=Halteromyces radiatus TaxID=101107 RepID=UPI00221F601E|nr:uncharacterized protein BX664DRAFT_295391 [Halteromyces radiatus]KAI8093569.1 hypothetical protein BX664DRAFT_295391 [Halteromyces radiatus]